MKLSDDMLENFRLKAISFDHKIVFEEKSAVYKSKIAEKTVDF